MSDKVMPEILDVQTLHDGWTELVVARVRLEDGAEADREILKHDAAAAVLPYDPERRVALLVTLMRPAILLATGATSSIEAPAGMVEDGSAAETACREAVEEAGVTLRTLEPVGEVWTSPGILTERLSLFLAPYRQADRLAQGGGAPGEHENITVVELPLQQLWREAHSGSIADHKTLTLILTLYARHPELFAEPMPPAN